MTDLIVTTNKYKSWNITIAQNLSVANPWFSTLKVPFTPDTVKVKSIAYNNGNAAEVGSFVINSGLLNHDIGCMIINFISLPDLEFKLGTPVDGSYQFSVRDLTTNPISITAVPQGKLSIQLEFRKYF